MELIKVEDLSFAYDKEVIIRNAYFSINQRDVITIVGPNGGGKTTLIRLIMGQLKPQKGTVELKNNGGRLFGYVPQYSTMDPSYPITVFEVILSGRIKNIGFYNKADKVAAVKVLKAVGLEEQKMMSFSDLSGGQRQRALIARALVSQPEVLILDEPTANIDAESEKQLNELLKKLAENHTIIIVTHDLAFVNEMSTRVLCVNRNVKEHPLETLDDGVIHSLYSSQVKVVRHEQDLLHGAEK
ncbi:MAG: metal ABC transporter ATP-binding protein [Spirochaetales bacterium]|nr:metal ABC transporter ATP-binding protein [Spirochaetales bacterium]